MKIVKRILLVLLSLFFTVVYSNAQTDNLTLKIENVLKAKNARIGVAIFNSNEKDTLKINNDFHFPMQSVMKFPIALAVLSEIDKGNLSFEQKIEITPQDLLPKTWSPIKEEFPNGTTLTIEQILNYTVSESDNIGCDILLKLIGGTDSVQKFLNANHFTDISIKANEEQMHKDWNTQYQNWATPTAMNKLLIDTYNNKNQLLSKKSYDFIWKIMRETTGSNRLKGQLPKNTIVAHKTGTSGINNGIAAATNDVGVITLPNGQLIFISVFVAESKETSEINEKIISDIAKITWNYYLNK
ncbi:inhibitor-resistant extended-spectrum class A beta-lactamase VEB-14 [Pseudomonas aeruginosa]|uniref:Beta-lactamase n=2 Tax=Pseudomonas aeruginosa TaxID=287 RepID=A0A126G806_PSEAI|nr:inhibitor-resistant extended-spectrum class A beta-lactamase VEB-14 [Pseudomonas aeruginosa]ALB25885.1 class A beta-lactamase VEB-14 [Pseudomonas aeruginosa]AMJ32273.1 class A beta-lactamase VEB-14 [Pseudomonas aeruginosa]MDC9025150.1 inhibitor-resistant extended-spectrum class A beta-lactamase VEB-14 [Pseudomonas aeruginosa]HBN8933113.1 class A extended-spectrum beta-lactamase VEB-14 [Pseudomonas aeruginosa]HBN8933789.1 class A extended-spectrum beta-lactamase VEB-14 [Pseudomonas aeruginos